MFYAKTLLTNGAFFEVFNTKDSNLYIRRKRHLQRRF